MSIPARLVASISLSVLAMAAGLMVWATWSLTWPFDPLKMKPGSWTTTQKTYKPGDVVVALLDYCQVRRGTPRLDFTLEQDGRLMTLLPAYGNDMVMCERREAPITQLPYNTGLDPRSPAKIIVKITFRINVLREVVYHFETNEFKVEP